MVTLKMQEPDLLAKGVSLLGTTKSLLSLLKQNTVHLVVQLKQSGIIAGEAGDSMDGCQTKAL
jgi:hypothetical protein